MAAVMAGAAGQALSAASMLQAHKHHEKDVDMQLKAEKTTQKLHMHSIINETRHFVEAFVQAEAVHAQALAQGKQQHSESMAAARRCEQREGMRDAQANATTRVNTVLVCDTVLLGCAFGLVVEGLPEPWAHAVDTACSGSGIVQEPSAWEIVGVWDWLLLVYILFLGIAIGCLTISMYCGMLFLDLLTDFQIDDHHTDMTVAQLSNFLAGRSRGLSKPYNSSTNGTRIFTKWLDGLRPGDDPLDDLGDARRPSGHDDGTRPGYKPRRRPRVWYIYARRGLETGLVFLFVAAAVLLFIRLIRQFHSGWAAVMFVGCCAATVVLVLLSSILEAHDRAASKEEEFAASDVAFKEIDKNGNEKMSASELHELLKTLQLPFNHTQTKEFLKQFMDAELTDEAELEESLSRQQSIYSDCLSPREVDSLSMKKQESKRAFMRQLALVVQQVHNPDTFFSTQAGEQHRVEHEREQMKQMVKEQESDHAAVWDGANQLLKEFGPDGEYKWMDDSLETTRKVEKKARELLTKLVQAGEEVPTLDDDDEFLSPVETQGTELKQDQESLMPKVERP